MGESIRITAAELLRNWAKERAEECRLTGDIEGWANWFEKSIWLSGDIALLRKERP